MQVKDELPSKSPLASGNLSSCIVSPEQALGIVDRATGGTLSLAMWG